MRTAKRQNIAGSKKYLYRGLCIHVFSEHIFSCKIFEIIFCLAILAGTYSFSDTCQLLLSMYRRLFILRAYIFPFEVFEFKYRKVASTKGQLISKCPFGFIVWTKLPTKIFLNFCPEIFVPSWGLPGSFLGLPAGFLVYDITY